MFALEVVAAAIIGLGFAVCGLVLASVIATGTVQTAQALFLDAADLIRWIAGRFRAVKARRRFLRYQKVGGLHHWRIGRLGGSFYVAKR